MQEVEDWLYTIGLSEFILYFEEDGCKTLSKVANMTDDDVRAITCRPRHLQLLTREIERLRFKQYAAQSVESPHTSPDVEIQRQSSRRTTRRGSRAPPMRSVSVPPRSIADLSEYIDLKYGFQRKFGEMSYNEQLDLNTERMNRGKFRDHYNNNYIWVENNHINDVGCKYDGLSRKVDHKPSHWRCEDEIERGKEYKRINDENTDKIQENRNSISHARDWLVNDGGVVERVHKMSAEQQKTRYDINVIKRNMENLKAMRTRLLKS